MTAGTPAIERSFSILEFLANSCTGRCLAEITRALELPKSSAHRAVQTLWRQGYLARNERTGRYHLSFKLFLLGNKALTRTDLHFRARPALFRLMRETALTVFMGVPAENEAVLIDQVQPSGPSMMGGWTGRGMGFHCTAIGKALLAHSPSTVIARVLASGRIRYNENTLVSARSLLRELAEIRRLGYATDNEEHTLGLRSIGAPVFDYEGNAVAAISVGGLREQIHAGNGSVIAARVVQSAREMSRLLGSEGDAGAVVWQAGAPGRA